MLALICKQSELPTIACRTAGALTIGLGVLPVVGEVQGEGGRRVGGDGVLACPEGRPRRRVASRDLNNP